MFDDDKPADANHAPAPQVIEVRMRKRPQPLPSAATRDAPDAMPAVPDAPQPLPPNDAAEPLPTETSHTAPAQVGAGGVSSTDVAAKTPPRRRRRSQPQEPKRQPTGDYETGYCRTPVHTRFKKGKSGNPRGPRKRKVTIQSAFLELLAETTTVTRDGKRMVMSKAEILAHQVWQRAMQGQAAAINAALKFAPELKGTILDAAHAADSTGDAEAGISATDLETMRWFLDGYDEEVNEEHLKELEADLAQAGDEPDEQ